MGFKNEEEEWAEDLDDDVLEHEVQDIGIEVLSSTTIKTASIGQWAGAMSRAMREIVPPPRTNKVEVKDRSGKFLYSYWYADISQCWEAIRGPLGANGLTCNQFPKTVGDPRLGHMRIETWICHESGEYVISSFDLLLKDPEEIQKVGGRITYGCRYCLEAIFGLQPPGYDDDASHATHDGTGRTAKVQTRARTPNGTPQKPPQAATQLYDRMWEKFGKKDECVTLMTGALRKLEGVSEEAVWSTEWLLENPLTDEQYLLLGNEVDRMLEVFLTPEDKKRMEDEHFERTGQRRGKTKADCQKERRDEREKGEEKEPIDGSGFEPGDASP